jgi:serine/threonine protein kinase
LFTTAADIPFKTRIEYAKKIAQGKFVVMQAKTRPFVAYLACVYPIFIGIAYLHAHNITHSDLKPGNVLFGPSGEIQISDFGKRPLYCFFYFSASVFPQFRGIFAVSFLCQA